MVNKLAVALVGTAIFALLAWPVWIWVGVGEFGAPELSFMQIWVSTYILRGIASGFPKWENKT